MGVAIVITSGKGGVGKTTTTANVGTSLALLGKKVCLVDTDIGLRNLDVIMGLGNRVINDLVDVVDGNCKLSQALIKDKRCDHLFLLPAANTKDKSAVSAEQMKKLIEELKQDFDYVLIDCPAGIEQGYKNAVAGADQAIVVTTPEHSAVRDADRIIGLLESEGKIQPKILINRIRNHMVKTGNMLDVDDVLQQLGKELIGVVADEEFVIESSHHGQPAALTPSNRASVAYRNIARRILGESIPIQSFETETGMFSKVKKLFGIR